MFSPASWQTVAQALIPEHIQPKLDLHWVQVSSRNVFKCISVCQAAGLDAALASRAYKNAQGLKPRVNEALGPKFENCNLAFQKCEPCSKLAMFSQASTPSLCCHTPAPRLTSAFTSALRDILRLSSGFLFSCRPCSLLSGRQRISLCEIFFFAASVMLYSNFLGTWMDVKPHMDGWM